MPRTLRTLEELAAIRKGRAEFTVLEKQARELARSTYRTFEEEEKKNA
jgi:hypothetical protein